MKKIFFFFTITTFLFALNLEAQSIRRSTLSSVARKSTTIGNIKVSSSLGQNCISCSTLSDGENSLRQGFQQPPQSLNDNPCGFDSGIAVEVFDTECGTYFNFEYTGLGNPTNATFEWDFGTDAAPATSTEMNIQDVGYSSTGDKLVRLVVTGIDGCSETITQTIQVINTAFAANELIIDDRCFGTAEGSVELEISGGVEPYKITWADGQITSSINGLKPGTYNYTISDSDGCIWENIAEVGGPTQDISISTIAKEPESCAPASDGRIVILPEGGMAPYFYDWSNGDITEEIDSLSAGMYTVTVTDANDCTQTAGFEIGELCLNPNEIVYDILTPNDDGQNDVWYIEGIENYPDNEVAIYNRWGNMVWSKSAYTNDWRGINNDGKKLPAGGYYYIVLLNDADNTRIGGAITILR